MALITPKTDFDFDVVDKGTWKFITGEAGVDEKADRASGKRFWVVCKAVDGGQEGRTHIESFFENTKDDFSLSKMAGFLMKIGVIKPVAQIDSAIFKTPEFVQKWKATVPNREFGAKISHRTKDRDGKPLENPQSEMRAYYTIAEYNAIKQKKNIAENADVVSTLAPEPETDLWS